MTAINLLQTNKAIYFFSDGAFIEPTTGRVAFVGQKVFGFPAARFAVGVSGLAREVSREINLWASEASDINQFVGDMEAVLPKMIEVALAGLGYPSSHFGIYVGGFSPAGERQFFSLEGKTSEREFKFTRRDADAWHYSPTLTPHSIRLAVGNEKGDEFDRGFESRLSIVDPIAHGLIALEAQRKLKVSDPSLPGGSAHTVGSFAQVTIVTQDRVESRILKRWSDALGAPIAPDGAKVRQAGFGKIDYQPSRAIGFKGANDVANGIDTASSSNYSVNSSAGYVAPTTASGTVDGNFAQATKASITLGGSSIGTGTSVFHGFRWAATATGTISTVVINVASVTASGNVIARFYSNGSGHPGTQIGTASNTVNITASGNVTFTFSSPPSVTSGTTYWIVIDCSTNSTANMAVTTAATIAGYDSGRNSTAVGVSPDNYTSNDTIKVQINYTGTPNNMTLVTVAQTADASASNVRVIMEIDNSASPTLNTDLTVEVTCNGGTNWTSATLASVGTGQSGRKVVETGDTACTAGTSVAVRIKTANGKDIPIYGLGFEWH